MTGHPTTNRFSRPLLVIFSALSLATQGQPDINRLVLQERYAEAYPLIAERLKQSPDDPRLNYQAGLCLLHSRSRKAEALGHLQKCVNWSQANASPKDTSLRKALPLLGDAYALHADVAGALKCYEAFLRSAPPTSTLAANVRSRRDLLVAMQSSLPLPQSKDAARALGAYDYTAVTAPDKSYVQHSFKTPVREQADAFFEEMPAAKREKTDALKASPNGKPVTDTVLYSANVGTSVDGQMVVNYRNENGTARLYLTQLSHNKWSPPELVLPPPNPAGWEAGCSVSADGKLMCFASERKGGFGGKDIYYCTREPDGSWSKAKNAGGLVNGKFNDEAPFIQPDGTLFFSSDRVSAGSLDVFCAKRSGDSWLEPVNVGFPVNRDERDIFQVTEAKKTKKKDSKKDTLLPVAFYGIVTLKGQGEPLHLLAGRVTGTDGKAQGAEVKLTDANTNTGSDYFPDPVSGRYLILLEPRKRYEVDYTLPNHLFQTGEVIVTESDRQADRALEVKLAIPEKGAATKLSNIAFGENSNELLPRSAGDIGLVAAYLQDHPETNVTLRHTIFSKTDKRMNRRLAKERAESLVKAVAAEGVSSNRLRAEGLREKEMKEPGKKKKKKENAYAKDEKPVSAQLTELIIDKTK